MSARHWLEYATAVSAARLIRALPLEATQRLIAAAARCYFDRGGQRVGYALANLRIAFPELSEAERRAIGRQSYVYTAWNVLDWVRALSWSDDDLRARVEMVGIEHVRAALARGKGAIGITLHMGNFELAVKVVPLHGIALSAVARPMSNRRLYERIVWERGRTGAEVIGRSRAAPEILRALRRNRLVALLIDQYSRRSHGVFVPLFGARCSTSAGAATMAVRTGAPVVPIYVTRVAPDRHRVVFLPALEAPATGDRKRDIEQATARYNAVLERLIREHPEQWMWAHRRFRHSPDLPDPTYA